MCVAFFLQVTVTHANLARPTHLRSMKGSKDFNTTTRGLTALITILLWQAALVIVVLFSSLLSFLCEVVLANMAKRNTGEKTGLSPSAVDALLAVTIPTLLVGDVLIKSFLIKCR